LYVNLPDPLKNIRIVMCTTAHPGNIGSAARAMRTMGITDLALVNPKRYPHPESQWFAAGAMDVLDAARVCCSLDEALAGVSFAVACTARRRDIATPMVDARAAALEGAGLARVQKVAFVFGNETYGLTNEEVSRCNLLASIPVDPEFFSLNVAAAVQVFCYELRMACGGALPAERPPQLAALSEVEAFYGHLESTLVETGFHDPRQPRKLMQRLRRLFGRVRLHTEEVNILRGILSSLVRPKSRTRGTES
jgi:tRNA/rRNA methyltransferase